MSTKSTSRNKRIGTVSPTDVPLRTLPVIELSGQHLQRVAALAQERNESYDSINGGVVFGPQEPLDSHQIGLIGELAVALSYGTDIDCETYKFGDNGTDLTLWGQTVDVKSTATRKMELPQLLVRADKQLTSDLYFLAHVLNWGPSGARVRILGYTTREQVIAREPECHPGTRQNYVVDPSELTIAPWLDT